MMLKAAQAACDFYIEHTPTDGIPYWDTGAPDLWRLGDYLDRPAEVFNDWEPVDSSAAAIAAQGLLRLGHYLQGKGECAGRDALFPGRVDRARHAFRRTLSEHRPNHQGLILHSIYHRPNGWDRIPPGSKIPLGESSQWGDYHAREAALYVQRLAEGKPYYTFFGS